LIDLLEEVIKGKLNGETVVIEEGERPMRAEVIDLAERLRASLQAASGGRKAARSKTAAAKPRARSSGKKKHAA